MTDSSDDPWGLLALVTVALFLLWKKSEIPLTEFNLILPALLVSLYTVTYSFLPPLLRAGIAITAAGCIMSSYRFGTPFHLGTWGLLLLSLPIVSSLQFYLGYPLRVLTGTLATYLLQLNGFAVIREGTSLSWLGQFIWIDAPCSGVRMLWAGLYLTFTLACVYELSAWRTCLVTLLSLSAIIAGNTFRATGLFYLEAGIVKGPPWFHEGIGVVIFLLMAIFIAGCSWYIQRERREKCEDHIGL